MKRLIAVLILLLLGFAVYARNRLFVRDPMGSVTRAGVNEEGAQVFINFQNEALIENDNTPMYMTIIQKEQHVGTPVKIQCLHYLVCLVDSEQATLATSAGSGGVEAMDGQQIRLKQGKTDVVVKLR
jgi:hypothetical protein